MPVICSDLSLLILLVVVMQMSSPWNDELMNAMQMGLIPNLAHDAVELNGNRKSPWIDSET